MTWAEAAAILRAFLLGCLWGLLGVGAVIVAVRVVDELAG